MLDELIAKHPDIKITALRRDVLQIFAQASNPVSAYEVLNELKQVRKSAAPPTVYRVIDYFVEKNVIHRIASENKFVLCCDHSHSDNEQASIMLLCKRCHASQEIIEPNIIDTLTQAVQQHRFTFDNPTVEITGFCNQCANNAD